MGDSSVDSTEGISALFVLFLFLLALALVLSKLLRHAPVIHLFGETGIILLLGMTSGFIVNLFVDNEVVVPDAANDDDFADAEDDSVALSLLSFSPQVFFLCLLPPIIFNSGYHLKRELFFRHFTPVALFAVFGTTVAAVFTALLLQLVTAFGLTGGFNPSKSLLRERKYRTDCVLARLYVFQQIIFDSLLLTYFSSNNDSLDGTLDLWSAHISDGSGLHVGCLSSEARGSPLVLPRVWRICPE